MFPLKWKCRSRNYAIKIMQNIAFNTIGNKSLMNYNGNSSTPEAFDFTELKALIN
jgi:hypothetical protein